MARRVWLVMLVVLAAGCRQSAGEEHGGGDAAAEPAPIVTTNLGQVRGYVLDGVEVFRGIPYAAPPVGPLRFRPPAPAPSWSGIRDATRFGSRCPQVGIAGSIAGSEDCLTLDVWRSATPATQPRPVLVLVHGGANVGGSGSNPLAEGRRMVDEHEVVVVSINYRLGLLGFLAHPGLRAESGTSGNWAHLDQIAALDWVAANIAAFGGDPQRVTVVGESAGASAVCVLLASPLAKGRFAAAIMQSGTCQVAKLGRREFEGQGVVRRSGCADEPEPIECLRALSIADLIALAPTVSHNITSPVLPIGGAIDGYVLPRSPAELFAAGERAKVPTLVGSTADETSLWIGATIVDCEAYATAIARTFPVMTEAVLAEYPCAAYPSPREAYVRATTDSLLGCEAQTAAVDLASGPGAAPVYRYWYSYVRADPAVSKLRAYHGSEMQLLWGPLEHWGYTVPAAELALAEVMQRSWVGLARSGSPVHAGTPGWTAYDPERDNAVVFASPVEARDGIGTEHCEFWAKRD